MRLADGAVQTLAEEPPGSSFATVSPDGAEVAFNGYFWERASHLEAEFQERSQDPAHLWTIQHRVPGVLAGWGIVGRASGVSHTGCGS